MLNDDVMTSSSTSELRTQTSLCDVIACRDCPKQETIIIVLKNYLLLCYRPGTTEEETPTVDHIYFYYYHDYYYIDYFYDDVTALT